MPTAPKRTKPAKSDGVKKAVRVPRACDNCRLRKSKCDGQLPCSFCQLHASECTYDNSRPKKQLDTRYIVQLERTVDRFKEIVGIPIEIEVTPEYLEDFELEPSAGPSTSSTSRSLVKEHVSTQTSTPGSPASPIARDLLESMVEATGRLNIDEDGNYDYSGNSAGLILVENIRERCDYLLERKYGLRPTQMRRSQSGTPHRALSQSRPKPRRSSSALLPWEQALQYIRLAFAEAFSTFNIVHRPSFERRIREFYQARHAGLEFSLEDARFDTLLYALFALGELFSGTQHSAHEEQLASSFRAERFFTIAQESLDLMECRDIISLQTLMCLIIYLQGVGQLPSCYTYISLAMTAAVRMGLHRADSLSKLDPVEREVRKRIFWSLRSMEAYLTTVLDLPKTVSDEDTDQTYPLELDDELITPRRISNAPANLVCCMSSVNAHTKLGLILSKVKKIASGSREGIEKPNSRYLVDYAKIVEAENDLAEWAATLPDNSDPVDKNIERAQLLVRVAHGHVQMVLYRPFLHHIARRNTDADFNYRAFACASACIKAASQVIWLVEALNDGGLLNGPSWLLFYTTFMAVVSSMMFVISNKDDPTAQEYYAAAQRGFRTLKSFAGSNQIARNYTESLKPLFGESTTPRRSSDDHTLFDPMITPTQPTLHRAAPLQSSNNFLKPPAFGPEQRPSPALGIQHSNSWPMDPFSSAPPDPMITTISNAMPTNTKPLEISLPPAPQMADPLNDNSASQIYLQAMNCTPTNFFEGFSSETAMMDYFSWHEATGDPTAGPSGHSSNTGGFHF